MKIGRAELTTDHPASSYGIPVLVMDCTAYGPDDLAMDNLPIGAHMASSDEVNGVGGRRLLADTVDALCRWLGQSPVHGVRWIADVRRAQQGERSNFADEQ